ncbi:hypothetical protein SAMN02799630_04164 [Paenibacillus sp. UNCCL117]|nr:hypothetical protein SAMN04488602_11488 [Paenibacillus sp. cl123]SFW54474.1 hypothetical protein SAMN02799630_04164 [Paenibacillus sp. UNCCL117]
MDDSTIVLRAGCFMSDTAISRYLLSGPGFKPWRLLQQSALVDDPNRIRQMCDLLKIWLEIQERLSMFLAQPLASPNVSYSRYEGFPGFSVYRSYKAIYRLVVPFGIISIRQLILFNAQQVFFL